MSRLHSCSTPTREELITVTNRYLTAFANNKTHPLILLTFFSTTSPVTIQHYPSSSSYPQASILRGPNAVRSYFDLIATHWTRSAVLQKGLQVDPSARTVMFQGSVTWKWKQSGRSWVEDFTCILAFDELLKIVNYVVRTDSAAETCLMRAKDVDDALQSKIISSSIVEDTNWSQIHYWCAFFSLTLLQRGLSERLPFLKTKVSNWYNRLKSRRVFDFGLAHRPS